MDFYKEYIQTNYMLEVESYKKRGYEVINVHTKYDESETTVFTLGLSYKTAYERVQQMVLDLEKNILRMSFSLESLKKKMKNLKTILVIQPEQIMI